MKKRHINIPVFIPHLGCPNMCVFCNQRLISGSSDFNEDDLSRVRDNIDKVLDNAPSDAVREIAFFGGSFTGIDRRLMIRLLDIAEEYVNLGKVDSIRLSTRPDYIDGEIIDILKRYSIGTVELGIQSMNDRVLALSKRGHTTKQTESACRMLLAEGIPFVGQMMIGLPGADSDSEIYTAQKICDMGASGARIYPTVVFKDTELLDMTRSGQYVPLDCESAVERTKAVLAVFAERGVPILRVGLCASDNLSSDEAAVAGAAHPALGELVMGELYYDVMRRAITDVAEPLENAEIIFAVPSGEISKCAGQNKINKKRLAEEFKLTRIRFVEDPELQLYNVRIMDIKRTSIPDRRKENCT